MADGRIPDMTNDPTIEEILADIKERSKKYRSLTDGDALSGIDSLLLSGGAAGFSDYEGEGDSDALVFVPKIIDADDLDVREESVEAERFDDPAFSGQYEGEGVFDEYVRELRASRGEADDPAAEPDPRGDEAAAEPRADGSHDGKSHTDADDADPDAAPKTAPVKTAAFNLRGMENSEHRQRFMSALVPQRPFDYDPKKDNSPIEKPGVLFEDGGFNPSDGLLTSPRLRPAEDLRSKEEKTIVVDGRPSEKVKQKRAPADEQTPEIVDGQIVLKGFHEEQKHEVVNEEDVESELREKRLDAARRFKLYDFAEKYEPDLPTQIDLDEPKEIPGDHAYAEERGGEDGADGGGADEKSGAPKRTRSDGNAAEYHSQRDRTAIGRLLQKDRRNSLFTLAGLVLAEIALIVLTVMARGSAGNFDMLYGGSLILTATAMSLCISTVLSGFKALFRLKFNCDSALALMFTVTLIHTTVAFLDPKADGIASVYCAAAVFSLLLNQTSRFFAKSSAVRNFKFCAYTYADSLYAIQGFDKKNDSFEIGRNLLLGDPELCYSSRVKFPSGFMRNSAGLTEADRRCMLILPAALALSLAAALAGWLKAETGLGALTAFTGAICVTMPAGAALSITLPMFLASRRLTNGGGMIVSPEAAAAYGKINGIVIDSADLYDETHCDMVGFKDFKAVRIDDVFIYAASMIISSGGPLSSAFERIVGSIDILPPAKSLKFEEKLGLSAWIHGQKVLLGNRNLLINHSIEAPPKSAEARYTAQGRRVLYMAIDNKLTAMFVVEYAERQELEPYLKAIEASGISVLVSAMDSNLTEDFISEGFGLTSGCVKIISPAAAGLFRENRQKVRRAAECAAMHDGRVESLLHCVAAASALNGTAKIAALCEIIGSAVGLLMLIALLLAKGVAGIGALPVMGFAALWAVVGLLPGILRGVRGRY